ncbi:hypothetical protein RRG08_060093 [Elysia crispata]|uniref:Uncharacterized protein n=1 Tax=Elysia crispata TaxID=231223 RepID=A0AAE0Z3S4_9GAST|nr:hypothetical protein RRG08_060093 [Elysia crispata]
MQIRLQVTPSLVAELHPEDAGNTKSGRQSYIDMQLQVTNLYSADIAYLADAGYTKSGRQSYIEQLQIRPSLVDKDISRLEYR